MTRTKPKPKPVAARTLSDDLAAEVTSNLIETFRTFRDALASAYEKRATDHDAEPDPGDAERLRLSTWTRLAETAFRRIEESLARAIFMHHNPGANIAASLTSGRLFDGQSICYGQSVFTVSVKPSDQGGPPEIDVVEVDLGDAIDVGGEP